jgi:hypothetical protein
MAPTAATTLAALGLCVAGTQVEARGYTLNQSYVGSSFFDNFNFYTGDDPTHGYVDFISSEEAIEREMIGFDNATGLVYMGAEYSTIPAAGERGRKAIRLESRYTTSGNVLVVLDMAHMPSSSGHLAAGCGVWPAFWSFGPDWPSNGEIDIVEYVNNQNIDATTLHTGSDCDQTQEDTSTFTGTWGVNMYGEPGMDCDVDAPEQWQNAGCGIAGPEGVAVGATFNSGGGGVYALEWVTDTEINAFYFSRDSIPDDIVKKIPSPSSWGLPYARFEVGPKSDCSSDHFSDHSIIFDLTFCGDWAGSVFGSDCQTSESCNDYVQYNPAYFQEAHWLISYLDVYDISN